MSGLSWKTPSRLGLGALLLLLLGAEARVSAAPLYSIKDLGEYSAVDAMGGGGGRMIYIDQAGAVSFSAPGNGGRIVGSGPVPDGEQPIWQAGKTSDNGLYTVGLSSRDGDMSTHGYVA